MEMGKKPSSSSFPFCHPRIHEIKVNYANSIPYTEARTHLCGVLLDAVSAAL